jgi:hypothetical protein
MGTPGGVGGLVGGRKEGAAGRRVFDVPSLTGWAGGAVTASATTAARVLRTRIMVSLRMSLLARTPEERVVFPQAQVLDTSSREVSTGR